MWHAGEEAPADQVRHPECPDNTSRLRDALLRTAAAETVAHRAVLVGGDAAVVERMLPAAHLLVAVAPGFSSKGIGSSGREI